MPSPASRPYARVLFDLKNSFKGLICGVLVLLLIYSFQHVAMGHALLRMFRTPLICFGPPVLYPVVLSTVFQFQLPPLPKVYIRRKWPLWIPGLLITCLPCLDQWLLNRWIIRLITG